MLEVIDDFLPVEEWQEYNHIHTDIFFPWFFMPSTTKTVSYDWLQGATLEKGTVREFPGLIHTFFESGQDSPYQEYALNLVSHISQYFKKDIAILRARSNLLYPLKRKDEIEFLTPHKDSKTEHLVGLYYINDSDGPTRFFEIDSNECKIVQTVQSKRNRMVIFSGNNLHAGQCPQETDMRLCTNINFNFVD